MSAAGRSAPTSRRRRRRRRRRPSRRRRRSRTSPTRSAASRRRARRSPPTRSRRCCGRNRRSTSSAAAPARAVVGHRVGVVGMGAGERRGEGVRPRLLHVERHRIGKQRLEPLGGDLRRVGDVEPARFRRLQIHAEAGELVHHRPAERRRRAQQIEEEPVQRREDSSTSAIGSGCALMKLVTAWSTP